MENNLLKYGPIVLLCIGFIVQFNLFTTPEKLEQKHREILLNVAERYVTKDQYNAQYTDLKNQLNDIQNKMDKVYEVIMGRTK